MGISKSRGGKLVKGRSVGFVEVGQLRGGRLLRNVG